LQRGIPEPGGVWADFGSGSGAFTLALAECMGSTGEIISVDKDGSALGRQRQAMSARFPTLKIRYLTADFSARLSLPILDGVLMANSLHFLFQKDTVVQLIRSYLRPGGRLIIVEYNVDKGNFWVPHPFSYQSWATLAAKNGFARTEQLASRPSHFLDEIYSALSFAP
jgi:ubiquinone/menaquinone biosynthesis C-methylase UbiE